MNDQSQLLAALDAAQAQGQDAVIATVIKVEGSAYRRPGARMIIPQLGGATGTVSGGCLESDVSKKAWWLTESGKPVIRTYSTGEDDDDLEEAELSFGLGCNGTVHILFERVMAGQFSLPVQMLRQVQTSQQPAALATVIDTQNPRFTAIGERLALAPVDGLLSEMRDQGLAASIAEDLQAVLTLGRSASCLYEGLGGTVEVLLEFIPAPRRLVIFGAGHDAAPLLGMARLQGWHTTVIDARPQYARAERFPEADQVLAMTLNQPLPDVLDGAAVVIMTHSYSQDRHWLEAALNAQPVYIGQLGPRSRTERLLDEMDHGLREQPAFAGLHYPVGLDLGGDTPESVALSVLAEINAVANRRNGGMLKHRVASIHGVEPAKTAGSALRMIG
ncbi:xanthine/CO dehydrogenase XdhC/CoxF family maturation factor [Pseudomonas sp. JUb42]|jgi:xanthine/CO dehydrogenase XdhC/CoxF family maturation factor|uniref:XdhC family protein n=1 Tax=Pseudomonas sp. JUb42 TaxID=2940611 RepID=UPI00216764E9|nr:XdhC/CoxI family protein [Pseudomonas sp. JUb42]MCS3468327.1 xanthine/CO dehydrogenase XdhC/CoxF family maturation factor [Pseudomonas sp. JUb42]